jgi:hypothetical protein
MENRKEYLINLRKNFLDYDTAKKIQNELSEIYEKEYIPKYTKEQYLEVFMQGDITIEKIHAQSSNWIKYIYESFSIASQHVHGFTKEHCLDLMYDALMEKRKRIEECKKLPTLHELVNSKIEIEPDKMYYTKEKNQHEDSCNGYSGDGILKMREMGTENYFLSSQIEWLEKYFLQKKLND